MSCWRVRILLFNFIVFTLVIVLRLFYWQVIQGEKLAAQAESQYFLERQIPNPRGEILSRDGFPLVTNQDVYTVFFARQKSNPSLEEMLEKIVKILSTDEMQTSRLKREIKSKLENKNLVWVPLAKGVLKEQRNQIESLGIAGVGFEEETKRSYPEGSMSAHLLGFLGKDSLGRNKGYFGLEGFYDRELRGRPGVVRQEKDAWGVLIPIGLKSEEQMISGRNLTLFLDRGIQFMVEQKLRQGMARYGAVAGSVVIVDPGSGGIISMASYPNYDPVNYSKENQSYFPNPVISQTFEPGSIFKVLVMAAAIDAGAIKPDDRCEKCAGPRVIGEYTVRTWDNKYHPDSTISEILEHSDNIGMIYVAERLGKTRLFEYLERFGIGNATGVDLEEESTVPLRSVKRWSDIDAATISFGQGVAVTPLQMVMAVSAIANGGILMAPFVVSKTSMEDREIEIKTKQVRRVIRQTTRETIKEMMVGATQKGEAKWALPKGYRIAGKTGTAQIPISGHYDEEKTIASFIGFAPADKPRFTMLVTLREPTSSPWGSETAAPLWFEIAKEIFKLWGIPPN